MIYEIHACMQCTCRVMCIVIQGNAPVSCVMLRWFAICPTLLAGFREPCSWQFAMMLSTHHQVSGLRTRQQAGSQPIFFRSQWRCRRSVTAPAQHRDGETAAEMVTVRVLISRSISELCMCVEAAGCNIEHILILPFCPALRFHHSTRCMAGRGAWACPACLRFHMRMRFVVHAEACRHKEPCFIACA